MIFSPSFTEAFMEKALEFAPPPPGMTEEMARARLLEGWDIHQKARSPVDWTALRELRPVYNSRLASTANPVVLVVTRVLDEEQECALEAFFYEAAKAALRELWPQLGATGDVEAGLQAMRFRMGLGSVVAGFDEGDQHRVWDKVVREDLPEADVLLVLDELGFAADLLTWMWALAFAKKDIRIAFDCEDGGLSLHNKRDFVTYASDPMAYWTGGRLRENHIFSALANGEAKARWVGEFNAAEVLSQEVD